VGWRIVEEAEGVNPMQTTADGKKHINKSVFNDMIEIASV
jgi:hypothetical protein